MRPLPDLDDVTAMAATGRRSVLMRARNDACEALRDACTHCQSADIAEAGPHAEKAIEAAKRLIEVSGLWEMVR
jgi:nitrite reductase/ring-hydroxylating ferredoxin subunit